MLDGPDYELYQQWPAPMFSSNYATHTNQAGYIKFPSNPESARVMHDKKAQSLLELELQSKSAPGAGPNRKSEAYLLLL